MYQVGEYLVYGFEGVCCVESIGLPKISGVRRDKLYYTLVPYGKSGAIYIPVDANVYMRQPISRAQIEALLSDLPSMPLCSDLPADPRMVTAYYQEILHSHDCAKVLQLYKTIYCKQLALSSSKKSLSVTDMRYWKQAEELLVSEFGYVLQKDASQIIKLLRLTIHMAD